MKYPILILSLLVSNSTFADMAIDCAREGKNNDVYLSDTPTRGEGWELEDRGDVLIGKQSPIQPSVETRDSLTFRVDNGTSEAMIYHYTGLRECMQNDVAEMRLEIFGQFPGSHPEFVEALVCDCAAD